MSCRQVNYANRRKAELIAAMGGRCWNPDCSTPYGPLHIDHPNGRNWIPRKTSFSARIARYWREWLAGEVRLLCEHDNDSNRFNGVTLPHPGAALEAVAEDPGCPF